MGVSCLIPHRNCFSPKVVPSPLGRHPFTVCVTALAAGTDLLLLLTLQSGTQESWHLGFRKQSLLPQPQSQRLLPHRRGQTAGTQARPQASPPPCRARCCMQHSDLSGLPCLIAALLDAGCPRVLHELSFHPSSAQCRRSMVCCTAISLESLIARRSCSIAWTWVPFLTYSSTLLQALLCVLHSVPGAGLG